ncbi:MAG: SsrA-binding protein SmpB [Candidatus Komeilibacteria bacterium]
MPEVKRNKRAHLDYEVLDTYEAGIVLTGAEVKSAKLGRVELDGSFVYIRNGEAWIRGLKISKYSKSGADQNKYQPDRNRRLLLNKKEILEISQKTDAAGLTIIPIFVYTTPSLVKLQIAIVRGKKKYDKREAIKKKEFQRRLNSRVRN